MAALTEELKAKTREAEDYKEKFEALGGEDSYHEYVRRKYVMEQIGG